MITYYKTPKGYIATDDSVKLHANRSPVGNALVFGREPTVAGNLSTIADAVFNPRLLGAPTDATSVPIEWQEALGLAPVKYPDKTTGETENLSTQDAEKNRGLDLKAMFIVFMAGSFLGRILAMLF
jgi:hypothetical protein